MLNQYRSYYRLFTLKFIFRAFFVKLLRIYAREVQQLDIADLLLARNIAVQRLKNGSIKVGVTINQSMLDIVLRRNTSDLLVFNQVILNKTYHPLLDIIERNFQGPVRVIIDVGGNIGLTSLFFHCYFKDATIHVIEPSARNFLVLKENMGRNQVRAKVYQKALLASNTRVKIANSFRDGQDWSTYVVPTSSSSDIEALSLTDFKRSNQFGLIDILKIDIEGHEAELFDSDDFLSELKSVRFLALEVHEEKADRVSVINKLQRLGFVLVYHGEAIFGFNTAAI